MVELSQVSNWAKAYVNFHAKCSHCPMTEYQNTFCTENLKSSFWKKFLRKYCCQLIEQTISKYRRHLWQLFRITRQQKPKRWKQHKCASLQVLKPTRQLCSGLARVISEILEVEKGIQHTEGAPELETGTGWESRDVLFPCWSLSNPGLTVCMYQCNKYKTEMTDSYNPI